MEDKGKMHLRMAGRSQGDGMESVSTPERGATEMWTSHLPADPYQGRPRSKTKEPKFVPYEPYKAAVFPINCHKTGDSADFLLVDSERVNSLASSIIKLYSNLEGRGSAKENDRDHVCEQMRVLEEKVAALEREKKDLQSQHQVQVEVNADLKRMLVASLGEDVQLRVQFMTEDKAALGKEVLRLAEEEERLSVHCSVWESKFKASSLMVKELVQWKNSLSQSLTQCHSNTEQILLEHRKLFADMSSALRNLETIVAAFDPGSRQTAKRQSSSSLTIVDLAAELKMLSNNIQDRLLGKSPRNAPSLPKYVCQLTQAEGRAQQLLRHSDSNSVSEDIPREPGVVAGRLLPHDCDKNAPTGFCKHCSGHVQDL